MDNESSMGDDCGSTPFQENIDSLKDKHAKLEQALDEENSRPMPNAVTLKEIKYQKLAIKDEITKLENR